LVCFLRCNEEKATSKAQKLHGGHEHRTRLVNYVTKFEIRMHTCRKILVPSKVFSGCAALFTFVITQKGACTREYTSDKVLESAQISY
jgi:hypothetical protein